MQDRNLLGISITVVSVAIAVSVLGVLLLIATARTPEQLRQIASHTNYLQQAVTSVDRGIAVSAAQHEAIDISVGPLDEALVAGSAALETEVAETYQPVTVIEQARWSIMQWLNLIDAQPGRLHDAGTVVAAELDIRNSVVDMRDHLETYSAAQLELFTAEDSFAVGAKEIVSLFRQSDAQRRADSVYVSSEQIKKLLRTGSSSDLDSILEIVDQLETVEAAVAADERSRLRILINSTYTMISLKRAMTQAEEALNQVGLSARLETLNDQVTQDQLYVLGTVNDARVLLNIYTVLLLVVLGFFGLRLRSSYHALNRSHDDLEVRVEERTADLEQANDDLKESQVQLVQAEKMSSLGQLVAGVMHEINTPLLYVLNNTSVTSEAVSELASYLDATKPILLAKTSEEGKEAIKQILARRNEFDIKDLVENIEEVNSLAVDSVDGLNQISELVQSLKDFSRLDRISDDTFDVREGIEKTLTITRNLLKQGVEVEKDFKDVPEIFCSPQRLNQVFINLITNAVQAMDGRGLLKISTSHQPNDDCVEIVFEDTGSGIDEENLSKIMDPFFTTKPVGEGTGLGLSIVHQIIDQHGGQIFIDSKVGHGTRIALSLPINGPDRQTSEEETEEAA